MITGAAVQPHELFLSHPHQAQGFSERLVSTLRQHGVPVWYSSTSIGGAQEWMTQIHQALLRCDWFAVVLCRDSLTSIWLQREVSYALTKPCYNGKIVPLLLEKTPIDYERIAFPISQFQHIDFTVDFETGCRSLLHVWGIGLDRTRLA